MTESTNGVVPINGDKLRELYQQHGSNPPFTVHCEGETMKHDRMAVRSLVYDELSQVSPSPRFSVVFAPPIEGLYPAIIAKRAADGFQFHIRH